MEILENCYTCLDRERVGENTQCKHDAIIFPEHCDDYKPDYDRITELELEDLEDKEIKDAESRYDKLLKAAQAVITESCNCMNPEFCNYKSVTPPCTEKMHDLCEIVYRDNVNGNH